MKRDTQPLEQDRISQVTISHGGLKVSIVLSASEMIGCRKGDISSLVQSMFSRNALKGRWCHAKGGIFARAEVDREVCALLDSGTLGFGPSTSQISICLGLKEMSSRNDCA